MSSLLDTLQIAFGSTYRLERELGGGGMSRVFLAEETALGRKVVIKVLPPELAQALSADRFRREIQVAAGLSHPNIVPLFSAGRAAVPAAASAAVNEEFLYYTMPFVDGESLRAKLSREGELPVPVAVKLLRDVAEALACAHEHGVVHRDIKPDNVMISRNHALVTDFGVAKALSEATGGHGVTSTGMAMGTPAYMAPEQASADPHVDHRADIYALGVLAYEMLSGQPPFVASTAQALLAAHVTQAPRPVTDTRPSVPPGLAALVARCLEKKPADRWQTAEELAQQLELMATPSGGTTPTMAVPVARAKPRPRWLLPALIAAGALGLAVVGFLLVWNRGIPEVKTSAASVAADTLRRLAVLPFKNLGSEEDRAFTDGLTEEITGRLVNVSGIIVTSRTSADRYRDSPKTLQEIGSELRVGYVLEGSVRWARGGDGQRRVRVTPQLIRVSDDAHVWAGQYDTTLADIFAVQSQIGERVVQALGVALLEPERRALAERPTSNQRAYEYFLRSKAALNRGQSRANLEAQQALLDSAVGLDSSFVRAWSDLAFSHGFMWWAFFDHTDARVRLMKAAADRTVALAPDHPDSHEAMAYYRYWIFRDYEGALKEVEAIRRQQPTNPAVYGLSGYIHRRQGKLQEALQDLARQQELDPGAFNAVELGSTLLLAHRYAEADSVFRVALAFESANGQALLGRAEVAVLQRGDSAAARGYVRDAARAVGLIQMVGGGDNATGSMSYLGPLSAGDDSLGPLLAAVPADSTTADPVVAHRMRGDVARHQGRVELARAHYDSARVLVERRRRERPDDYMTHYLAGSVAARLGLAGEALSATRKALSLLPPERDAWYGGELLVAMARTHALVGDPDSAVVYLRNALNRNLLFSVPLLRIDPDFAALHGRAGYEALIRKD